MDSSKLTEVVLLASQCTDALTAVRSIYARLQTEIDRRKPICVVSGKCCNFETYGHRLYVTTLELATFMQDLKTTIVTRASGPGVDIPKHRGLNVLTNPARAGGPCHDATTLPTIGPGCPLQIGRLCGVHAIRPFGCRIFFCDPTADDWQKVQYELFHAELKQLHNRFEIPYLYVEWGAALAALGIS
jgi:Fe-S-cluster containining protein